CVVEVPKGKYVLLAKAMDFDGRKRISRLRVVLEGVDEPRVGKEVGETSTDVALMAVCDIVALNEAIGGDNDKFQDLVMDYNYKDFGLAQLKMRTPISILYVST